MVETHGSLKRVRQETWKSIENVGGVFIDILSRLNVHSIRTYKTVSKSWNSAVSSKYFAKQQITQSRKNPQFIACPSMNRTMALYSIKPGTFDLVYLNAIDPGRRCEDYMYMISSFNGLICCVNSIGEEDVKEEFYDLQIWICNPSSGETLLLPQGRPSYQFEPSVGVAYSYDINDYKVFRIFSAGKKIPEERVFAGVSYRDGQIFTEYRYGLVYECEVYSSISGSWKNIGPVPCVPMNSSLSPYKCGHVFVGGKIYWMVSLDEPGEILCVDLEGRFEVMKLPEYPKRLKNEDKITEATYLINLRGSLSLVILHVYYMDIWVWKEEGKKSSWVLAWKDSIPFDDNDVVLAMTSSKNQILCVTETHWCSYDVDTKIWNRRRADSGGFLNPTVFPFTESVLPCNGRL